MCLNWQPKLLGKKKKRLNGEQSFKSLYILFGLQVMSNIYHTEFQKKWKTRNYVELSEDFILFYFVFFQYYFYFGGK